MAVPSDYPSQWETHAVLKDGSTVELRPIKASDRDALEAFHGRQSQESIYFRFFRYRPELSDRELDYFTQVDYRDRMAFVAVLGQELVAVARYEKWQDRNTAEVAFFVDDGHHGKGLATLMLEFLAAAARDRGLTGFNATVLPENYRMLAVFRSAGFDVSTRFTDGHIEVELSIEVTAETSMAIADRQRLATARSVARIVEPTSVAVIGASRQAGSVGHELIENLKRGAESNGLSAAERIFPVNPSAETIAGMTSFPSIAEATVALQATSETPDESSIDLAVVAVRAELVEGVVAECAAAGVQGLLIITTGFSELSNEGGDRERRLVELARANGMRLIGPNAFGLINTSPEVGLGAVFHRIPVIAGRVALVSESGPLGAAVLEQLRVAGVGVSSFVGIGNRSDVSVNDLLDYWGEDQATDVVVAYVENFGNLGNFSSVATRLSHHKPIITIRPSSQDLTDLLLQAGVIVVDEVSQLAEQAQLAATQPMAKGNRVVIVSNAASLGRLATTACRRQGLEVVVPSSVADTGTDDSVLIGDLDTVALMPSGDPDDYERMAVAAAFSDEVDLMVLALAPTAFLTAQKLTSLLDRLNRSIDKPMAAIGLVDREAIAVDGLPTFTFPEEAAQVLGRHAAYGCWSEARSASVPIGQVVQQDPDPVVVRAEALLSTDDSYRLTPASEELQPFLADLGIPIAPYRIVSSEAELRAAAEQLDFPVVLKAAKVTTRSIGESGGAAIDLHDAADLLDTYRRMVERLGDAMSVAIVQQMVVSTALVRLDLRIDPSFGSMVSIGRGGSASEPGPPFARRFLPLDETLVSELLDAVVAPGLIAADDHDARAALAMMVDRMSQAATRLDDLAMLTLNPILIAGSGTVPVDVEVALRRRLPNLLAGLRHI